jgi:hypothetical protein
MEHGTNISVFAHQLLMAYVQKYVTIEMSSLSAMDTTLVSETSKESMYGNYATRNLFTKNKQNVCKFEPLFLSMQRFA